VVFEVKNVAFVAKNKAFVVKNEAFEAKNMAFEAKNEPFVVRNGAFELNREAHSADIRTVKVRFAAADTAGHRYCLYSMGEFVMARFPQRDSQLMALAQNVVAGLIDNPSDFPQPPVPAADLQTLLDNFNDLSDSQIAAMSAAERATAAKRDGREQLITALRSVLRYAEDAVGHNDARLTALGWGAKAARTPLKAPGQCSTLESGEQGEDWIELKWKKPSDGGAVSAYRIERRRRPDGDWQIVGMAVECRVTLTDQQRGIEWEYRIIAVNKTGEGQPSNTVAAVL